MHETDIFIALLYRHNNNGINIPEAQMVENLSLFTSAGRWLLLLLLLITRRHTKALVLDMGGNLKASSGNHHRKEGLWCFCVINRQGIRNDKGTRFRHRHHTAKSISLHIVSRNKLASFKTRNGFSFFFSRFSLFLFLFFALFFSCTRGTNTEQNREQEK